jgi:hypothetical protein
MAVVGALGLGALWSRRRARRKPDELPVAAEPDPAEELRAKLAESKTATVDETVPPAEELVAAEGNGTPMDPEVRRRAVHERARTSIDDLK